jgi:N-acetylmuramoyl-L-alanine amidase
MKVVISSGHGKYIRGASGYIDEVDEARKVVESVADVLREMGVQVTTYHDDVSDDQSENLRRITDFHNAQGAHDLDVSVHFNAYETTSKPMGSEVLYASAEGMEIADETVDRICTASGLINRGPKERGDLAFLNNTNETAVLVETCFVDSRADCDIYANEYYAILILIPDHPTRLHLQSQTSCTPR